MVEIFLSVLIFGLLMAGMAIGVIVAGKPISGSCGGVGAALGEEDYQCELCGGDPTRCDELSDDDGVIDNLSYSAGRLDSRVH